MSDETRVMLHIIWAVCAAICMFMASITTYCTATWIAAVSCGLQQSRQLTEYNEKGDWKSKEVGGYWVERTDCQK